MSSVPPPAEDRRAIFQELYRGLFATPDLLPWQLDIPAARLLLARVSEPHYRKAAFLDERLNNDRRLEAFWVPLDKVTADCRAAPGPLPQANFIFHIGHCGSTLISRLLGHDVRLLPLREPLSLRSLASAKPSPYGARPLLSAVEWHEILSMLLRLFSRSYSATQRALIKATSNCNSLISEVLRLHDRHKAILLYTDIQVYLANTLRPQARGALHAFSDERIADLRRLAGDQTPTLSELSPPQLGAMSWCASMAEFTRAAADPELGKQIKLVNFEDFLRSRERVLTELCSFVGLQPTSATIRGMLEADYLSTYSKDPALAYSPQLRADDLGASMRIHAEEIAEGMRWLRVFTEKTPSLAPLTPFIKDQAQPG